MRGWSAVSEKGGDELLSIGEGTDNNWGGHVHGCTCFIASYMHRNRGYPGTLRNYGINWISLWGLCLEKGDGTLSYMSRRAINAIAYVTNTANRYPDSIILRRGKATGISSG